MFQALSPTPRNWRPTSKKTSNGTEQHGAAIMEFALSLPVIILLYSGLLNIGTSLSERTTMINVARSAARTVSLVRDESPDKMSSIGLQTAMQALKSAGLNPTDFFINIQGQVVESELNDPAQMVLVTIEKDPKKVSVFGSLFTSKTCHRSFFKLEGEILPATVVSHYGCGIEREEQ